MSHFYVKNQQKCDISEKTSCENFGKGLRHAHQFDFFFNSGLSDQILMGQLLEKIGH